MAKLTKAELIEKLYQVGFLNNSNKKRFEGLTVADLENILSAHELNQQLEAALGESEAELAAAKSNLTAPGATKAKKIEPQKPGLTFTFRGQKFKFTDHAPKTLRWHGVAKTQEQLAKDEDALLQLVGLKSSLIIKIK